MKRNPKYQQEYDLALPITFGEDYVALDIPDDGIHTDSGWQIVPLQKALVSLLSVLEHAFMYISTELLSISAPVFNSAQSEF